MSYFTTLYLNIKDLSPDAVIGDKMFHSTHGVGLIVLPGSFDLFSVTGGWGG